MKWLIATDSERVKEIRAASHLEPAAAAADDDDDDNDDVYPMICVGQISRRYDREYKSKTSCPRKLKGD